MEQEMLDQIRQIMDMLRQLEEQARRSIPTEQDVESRNAINGLFDQMDKVRTAMSHMGTPAGSSGSSGGQKGVQTTCPHCGNVVTVTGVTLKK